MADIDTPIVFHALLALCPVCSRPFLLGIAEDDLRDLVDRGARPQDLSQMLIDAHHARRLTCADCAMAAAN